MTTPQIPNHLLERIRTIGGTAAWLAEQMGVNRRVAAQLLIAAGAVQTGGRYRLGGPRQTSYGSARECVPAQRSGVAWGSARDAC